VDVSSENIASRGVYVYINEIDNDWSNKRERLYRWAKAEGLHAEDTTLPTVSIKSLFISATIDTHEQIDVATTDTPGAFMQADMVGEVHVKLEGRLAEILAKLDPQLYMKYLHRENGKVVMYVKLKKTFYGTLDAAMFYGRI